MSVERALLWKEWRSIRREALLLAGLAVAWPLVWRLMPAVSLDIALITAGTFLLPGAAFLIGASLTAGDGALAFAAARPATHGAQALARFAVRLAAVAAIAVVATVLFLAITPDAIDRIAAQAPGRGEASLVLVALGGLLLACFSAAALASAFVERPLAAVFAGAALVACVTAGIAWAFGDVTNNTETLATTCLLASAGLLWLALIATAQRRGEVPVPPRALVRPVGYTLIAGAIAFLAWPFAMDAMIQRRLRAIEREVAAKVPQFAGAEERHPPVVANASHEALVAAARDIGYRVQNASWLTDAGPWLDYKRAPSAPEAAVSTEVTMPPSELVAWLDSKQDGMGAIRAALQRPELPTQRRPAAPVADWESMGNAYFEISRLLRAHARLSLARGNEVEARADLDAAWRLALAMRSDARASSQHYALWMARHVLAAARRLPAPAAEWDERLDIEPWRVALFEARQVDLARHVRSLQGGDVGLAWWEVDRYLGTGDAPAKIWAYRPLRRWNFVAVTVQDDADEAVALSQPLGCGPTGSPSARLLALLRADMELTRATHEALRAKAADPAAAWPEELPSLATISACPGIEWIYSPGDPPTIEARGELVKTINLSSALPLRVELH